MERKVWAYRHSQEMDGQRKQKEEVSIIDSKTENGVTTYLVRTQDGIECTAIYNIFTDCFFADDVYGIVNAPAPSESQDMTMNSFKEEAHGKTRSAVVGESVSLRFGPRKGRWKKQRPGTKKTTVFSRSEFIEKAIDFLRGVSVLGRE